MLDYTIAAKDKIVEDVKLIAYLFAIVPQIVYLAYLVYALATGTGHFVVNIVLLVISSVYFVFYLASHGRWRDSLKGARRTVRRSYKWLKLTITAYNVGATVYGIYMAASGASHISAILATVTATCWILQALIELLRFFVESEMELFVTAVRTDFENAIKPAKEVGNFIKRVTGGETEERSPEKTTHARRVLDRRVERVRERREEKNAKRQERFRRKFESIVDKISRTKIEEDTTKME